MKKIVLVILSVLVLLTPSVFAGTYMFRDKASNIDRWLVAKGESGSTYDMLMNHFTTYSNLSSGTLYDHVNNVMSQQGYSGTLDDKLTGFFIDTTGVAGRNDAERSFWSNDSYSFDPSSGSSFTFVDGNNFTFIDGNNFVFGS